jgi:hypothetical protein
VPLIRHPVLQHAYVVTDLDAAMAQWTEVTGAGPWWVSRNHYGHRHTYREQPFDEPLHYAFAGTGPTHVQLVQQDSATPSVYRDMFGVGEEGFHHVAVLVPEADHAAEVARFEAAGFPVASTLWSYVDVAYVDCREAIGCFVELHGANSTIYDLFELFRRSHEEWDGTTEPVRVRSATSSAR